MVNFKSNVTIYVICDTYIFRPFIRQLKSVLLSCNAGTAAEAAGASNNHRHETFVVVAGGSFFPVLVETLGLWTLFRLKALQSKISGISNISFSR